MWMKISMNISGFNKKKKISLFKIFSTSLILDFYVTLRYSSCENVQFMENSLLGWLGLKI